MKPHVIFDFGAVLFRWRPQVLLAKTLPHRVTDKTSAQHWQAEIFQSYQGDWGDFDDGKVSVPELVTRISTRTGLAPQEVQAVVDAVPDELAPIPGSVALLAALREAGHRLFFLSNMPEPYAQHLERQHTFVAWFEAGVFSARVGCRKPAADIFHRALERFGISPGDALFIDDHPANIAAAQALGLPALLFTTPEQLAQDFAERGMPVPAATPAPN